MPFQPRSSTKYLTVATAIYKYVDVLSIHVTADKTIHTPNIAGCLEKNKILPVGARAICVGYGNVQ